MFCLLDNVEYLVSVVSVTTTAVASSLTIAYFSCPLLSRGDKSRRPRPVRSHEEVTVFSGLGAVTTP